MERPEAARYSPSPEIGLTAEQVRGRMEAGLVNAQPPHITKSYMQILRENICTFFNALQFGIALCLVLVGSFENLLFLGVVISNLLIGTVQQIRAKRKVERLSVLNAARANVIRDGREESLPVSELVLDDVIRLSLGDQVPADAVILTGQAEANEALLTGESDPLPKSPGDALLSGSFLVSGACRARVEHVGEDNYANSLAKEARAYQKLRSALMRSLRAVVRFTGSAVLPLGLLLFLRAYFTTGAGLQDAVVQAAAAMIGMIPAGLMLLTSVSLAVSVVALARKNTLAQNLYCTEQLSRVDVLCLDKTGTLTAGRMAAEGVIHAGPGRAAENAALLRRLLGALPRDNATAAALFEAYGGGDEAPASLLPFSSARKYSAAAFPDTGTLYLGAPEAICPRLPDSLRGAMEERAAAGFRVLLLARDGAQPDAAAAPNDPEALMLILLADVLRPEAAETLAFFRREGVEIKLISGDNPLTVSGIARRLGLPGHDRWLDARGMEDEALAAAATEYTIFGRVSPGQKRVLVRALRAAGHTVAMTGDGVNDVLALKDADCSVAMAAGSDVAKQVASLVLLDNSFASLPAAVMEGRRVINNITRTASLFLVKTMFSFLLTVCSVLFGMAYPFEPVQLSLISAFTIGAPSFLLALEPNRTRITGGFLENVLTRALPGALLVFAYAGLANLIGPLLGLRPEEINTLCVYLTATANLCVLVKICLPMNLLRGVLCAAMGAGLFLAAVFLRELLNIGILEGRMLLLFLPMAVLCYPMLMAMTALARKISFRQALRKAKLAE